MASGKIGANFFDTIVPHPFRSDAPPEMFRQPNAFGEFRDYFFLIYQTNAIFGMGAIGGPVVFYLLYRAFRKNRHRGRRDRPQRLFWLAFVTFCLVVGVAEHGERDAFGVAHVTLQPLMVLGLVWRCLRAAWFGCRASPRASWPRAVRSILRWVCCRRSGASRWNGESAHCLLRTVPVAGCSVLARLVCTERWRGDISRGPGGWLVDWRYGVAAGRGGR